ncbi:MAG TPA: hypothetical protein VM328_04640, partial [Fimbriimonadaceae bacterium]|nr:hypothetical protein [Fimbriimonadaceae bacterium]
MLRMSWIGLAMGAVGFLPVIVAAQGPLPLNSTPPESTGSEVIVGGTSTIDLLILRAAGPGVPLRNGNVIKGSERVEFEGQPLQRGTDYSIDYESGVIYLMRAQKAGQALTVAYRYDKSKPTTTSQPQGGFQGFRIELMPGQMRAIMGLGMTERLGDG